MAFDVDTFYMRCMLFNYEDTNLGRTEPRRSQCMYVRGVGMTRLGDQTNGLLSLGGKQRGAGVQGEVHDDMLWHDERRLLALKASNDSSRRDKENTFNIQTLWMHW